MAEIRYREFEGSDTAWCFTKRQFAVRREEARAAARAFIEAQIGPDALLSVTEHQVAFGPFRVTVWYRADGQGA